MKRAARRITGTCVAVAFALGFPVQAMIPRQPWFVGLDPRSDRAVEQTLLEALSAAGLLGSPGSQVVVPPKGTQEPSDRPPVVVPVRHEDLLDELHLERDGRSNPDGSPTYKDLNPGPRRR